jgi:putative heme iron utilization protein
MWRSLPCGKVRTVTSFSPAGTARTLLSAMREGALATLGPDGAPFSSLVAVAPDAAGEPLLLLSGLAVHTQNIERDPRASLLLAAEPMGGEGLARARLTLTGEVRRAADQAEGRARFLARHPEAASYADFNDFAIHRFNAAAGHLVAGFGRIARLERSEMFGTAAG